MGEKEGGREGGRGEEEGEGEGDLYIKFSGYECTYYS